ncbi:COMM domain-containing protein 3 [Sergentomyia squamirostris]
MDKNDVGSVSDVLQLSQLVIKGLQKLNDLCDNEIVEKLIEKSIKRACVTDFHGRYPEEESAVILIEYALISLIVVAAKNDVSSNQLKIFLTDLHVRETICNKIVREYEISGEEVKIKLATYGHDEPFMSDVNWKMSCNVQSDSINTHGDLLYKISLEDVNGRTGEAKSITDFTCNIEELQSLITKLKDIERDCDRVASGK